MLDTLHDRIIERACRNDGWQRGPWKPSFIKKCKESPYWEGDLEGNGNGDEIWGGIPQRSPDAWRLVVEDENTPGRDWSYPILVLEFLEVEISHPLTLDKRRDYVRLWWRFDGTSCFHFRVYIIGRYGAASAWLDTESVYEEML